MGINPAHRTRDMLISEIRLREPKEEKEKYKKYKGDEIPDEFKEYKITTDIIDEFHTVEITLYNLPVDDELIATIMNWAKQVDVEKLTKKPNKEYAQYITITAYADVVGYGLKDGDEKTRRKVNLSMLSFKIDNLGGIIKVSEISDWLILNSNYFENLLLKSDMYANIERISKLTITFKMIEVSGSGYVALKKSK